MILDLIMVLALIPLTVGGLAVFFKSHQTWLRISGLVVFGSGLLTSLLMLSILRTIQ